MLRELQVFVSGELAETLAIEPGVPFETALAFEADAFVTIEVHGASKRNHGFDGLGTPATIMEAKRSPASSACGSIRAL